MRQEIQGQWSGKIQGTFLCRDELEDELYLEPRSFDRIGEALKVTHLMVYSLPKQTQLGAIAALLCP